MNGTLLSLSALALITAEHTCDPSFFACQNGLCIPGLWHCDSVDDCGDKSDEVNCSQALCGNKMFRCNDGKCISPVWRCDMDKDCEDGSDEICSKLVGPVILFHSLNLKSLDILLGFQMKRIVLLVNSDVERVIVLIKSGFVMVRMIAMMAPMNCLVHILPQLLALVSVARL